MSAPITAADIVVERQARLFGLCVYCGHPTRGLACRSHRDLLTLDPHQYEMRLRENNDRPGTSLRGAPKPAVDKKRG